MVLILQRIKQGCSLVDSRSSDQEVVSGQLTETYKSQDPILSGVCAHSRAHFPPLYYFSAVA